MASLSQRLGVLGDLTPEETKRLNEKYKLDKDKKASALPPGVGQIGKISFTDQTKTPIYEAEVGPPVQKQVAAAADPYSQEAWDQAVKAEGGTPAPDPYTVGERAARDEEKRKAEAGQYAAWSEYARLKHLGMTEEDARSEAKFPAGSEAKIGQPAAPPPAAPAPPAAGGAGSGGAMAGSGIRQPTGPVHIPAGWENTARSTAVQEGMSPEELGPTRLASEAATGYGVDAASKRKDYADAAARVEYDTAKAKADAIADSQARAHENALKRDAYIADMRDRVDALSKRAVAEIDPDAYWQGKGTASRVAGAIAVGIGEFAALMRGGQNGAEATIQNAVNANIRAQEQNIANARTSIDQEGNLLAKNMDLFHDKDQAILATKLSDYERLEQDAKAQYAKNQGMANEADFSAFMGTLADQRKKDLEKLATLMHTSRSYQESERYRQEQYITGATDKGADDGTSTAQPVPEHVVALPDGSYVQLGSKEEADKFNEGLKAFGIYQRRNRDLLMLRKEAFQLNPVTDHAKYSSLMRRINGIGEEQAEDIKTMRLNRVLRDDGYEHEVTHEVGADAGLGFFKGITPWNDDTFNAANDQMRSQNAQIAEDIQAAARTGGQVGQKVLARDKNGHLQPAWIPVGKFADPLPDPIAPNGAVAKDSSIYLPTAGPSLESTARQAPVLYGEQATALRVKGQAPEPKAKGGKGGGAGKTPPAPKPRQFK